jgi:hypothetical protein
MRVLKQLEVRKLPKAKQKQEERRWSHRADKFDIDSGGVLRRNIVKLENENDLFMEVNVQREASNREQNRDSCSKQHAHVN